MILETVLGSFFTGGAARVLFGEVVNWFKAREERKRETELMVLQGKLDAERHERQMEMIKLQKDIGVEVIRVQAEQARETLNDETWGKVVVEAMKPTGITFVDVWNGVIRPAAASFALFLWVHSVHTAHYVLQEKDWQMVFSILGFFFADRQLSKRGR